MYGNLNLNIQLDTTNPLSIFTYGWKRWKRWVSRKICWEVPDLPGFSHSHLSIYRLIVVLSTYGAVFPRCFGCSMLFSDFVVFGYIYHFSGQTDKVGRRITSSLLMTLMLTNSIHSNDSRRWEPKRTYIYIRMWTC